MSNQSPAQLLLARTPASVSAAQTSSSAHVASRPRHAASANLTAPTAHVPLQINATFSSTARNPGTVKVTVEDSVFYVHRDVMSFASSFWEALLDPAGGWLETSSDAPTSLVGGTNDIGIPERRWSRQIPLSRQTSRQDDPHVDTNDADAPDSNLAVPSSSESGPPTPTYLNDMVHESGDLNVETATVATSLADELVELKIEVSGGGTDAEDQETVGVKNLYEDYTKKVEARVNLKEEKVGQYRMRAGFTNASS